MSWIIFAASAQSLIEIVPREGVIFIKNELEKWVGDDLENPRRMKRDRGEIRGFIPGTVSHADLSTLF
jgi:hypothetical protein